MRKITSLLLAVIILFSSQSSEAGLLRKALIGGSVIGVGAAWYAACHDAKGNVKPGCKLKKKSRGTDDPLAGDSNSGSHDPGVPAHEYAKRDVPDINDPNSPDYPPLLRSNNTLELRKALNAELVDSGMPPDPEDCDAHHIVPQTEKRLWAKPFADKARDIIYGCNIDIDSAENGVYLPNKKTGSSQCKGAYHKTLHTQDYYQSVQKTLADGYERNGCNGVRYELNNIKINLMRGVFP